MQRPPSSADAMSAVSIHSMFEPLDSEIESGATFAKKLARLLAELKASLASR
jgi:hypothetical protein